MTEKLKPCPFCGSKSVSKKTGPEIDMAIRAINCCMIKRKPIDNVEGEIECPSCGMSIDEFDSERYCFNCGQALDWGEGKADG